MLHFSTLFREASETQLESSKVKSLLKSRWGKEAVSRRRRSPDPAAPRLPPRPGRSSCSLVRVVRERWARGVAGRARPAGPRHRPAAAAAPLRAPRPLGQWVGRGGTRRAAIKAVARAWSGAVRGRLVPCRPVLRCPAGSDAASAVPARGEPGSRSGALHRLAGWCRADPPPGLGRGWGCSVGRRMLRGEEVLRGPSALASAGVLWAGVCGRGAAAGCFYWGSSMRPPSSAAQSSETPVATVSAVLLCHCAANPSVSGKANCPLSISRLWEN